VGFITRVIFLSLVICSTVLYKLTELRLAKDNYKVVRYTFQMAEPLGDGKDDTCPGREGLERVQAIRGSSLWDDKEDERWR
jgi:hypothetical protein